MSLIKVTFSFPKGTPQHMDLNIWFDTTLPFTWAWDQYLEMLAYDLPRVGLCLPSQFQTRDVWGEQVWLTAG